MKSNKEKINLDIYFKLLNKPIFRMEDVNKYYDNISSARTSVYRLIQLGKVKKIRNNLYTCVVGENGGMNANRFQIACAINDTAYVSHHTAMEYYGITDQVFNDVYVSSKSKFEEFEFDGYRYHYVKPSIDIGVKAIKYSGGISVTDKERTVLDCIKDLGKISGLEEVIANIEDIGKLNEKKLLNYLKEYGNQFLYQKTGFFLSMYNEQMKISEAFFEECKKNIGKSKRYLTKNNGTNIYSSEWKIIVPKKLQMKNGGTADAII